jgi:hypothetical protein
MKQMSSQATQPDLRILQDRQAILDCIHRYCRGVDRFDRDLVLSVYHSDAIDDHGVFVGPPADFADWAFAYHREHQHLTQHIVTNHNCELDGDSAHTETYWMLAAMNKQGAPLSLSGGRYIDRFERRAGRWAIAARRCTIEWYGRPGEEAFPAALLATYATPSRDRNDPSYERPMTIDPRRIGLHL